MARKRMIDPSFWEDEKLGTLEPLARLLFMGLISQADDEGRLKGHPSLLRSLIFPYDDYITLQQIEEWLEHLNEPKRHLIERYEVDNQKYIWIRNFKKHQTINKPQKSKLPSIPNDYGSTTVPIQEQDGTTTAQEKRKEEKEKRSEGEEKGKEESPSPSDILNNTYETRVKAMLAQYEVTTDKPFQTDQFYSYIGAIDMEVIEAAIKKSKGRGIAYCLGTLEGMIKDGVTKDTLKPKVGDGNGTKESGTQHGGAAPTSESITGGKLGWLPSKWNTGENVIQMPNVSG